ncbi:MAG: nucleotidyltransferase domain-containing protein [Nanoarchaeota archaeon]|nr:nucleotidyltransferase domain-containing protein [Nanoarchaeota archaeon]
MLTDLLKNIKFKNKIKEFYKKNREDMVDIILFGSVSRGKTAPKDIDILLIFNEKENNDLSYGLRKDLQELGISAEITIKKYKDVFSSGFLPREDILSDGFSLISNKRISEAFGYKSFMLFKYSLKGFNYSQRMRFYYALEGRRDKKGMLKEMNGIKFTNSVVLVPVGFSDKFEAFLNGWNIEIKKTRILIPDKSVTFMKF